MNRECRPRVARVAASAAGVGMLAVLLLSAGVGAAAEPSGGGDDALITYRLHAGEGLSAVADMFHVSVEDLLAVNHIRDARHLAVGTALKIPDPRATAVTQLRSDKAAMTAQLAKVQADTAQLRDSGERLQEQLAALHRINAALESERSHLQLWRLWALAGTAGVVALACALLVAWDRAKTAERRYQRAAKEAEVLHTAVEKYRQLTAQFELRYQSLFHQAALSDEARGRVQNLRQAYEEDRARLDAVVGEAERQIQRLSADIEALAKAQRLEPRLALLSAFQKRT